MNEHQFILLIIKCAFLGIGALCILIGGITNISHKKKLKNCTQLVTSKVVEIQKENCHDSDGRGFDSWFPVFEYYANGHNIRKKATIGNSKPTFHVGQTVQLYIDPENETNFYYEQDNSKMFGRIFFYIGIVFLLVGIITFVIEKISL